MKNTVALLMWLLISFSAAFVGGLVQPGEWYAGLNKPSWNPPSWLFGPVWTLLYAMIGVAAWRVWRKHRFQAPGAWTCFAVNWLLNAAWSVIFFRFHQIGWALVDIVLLWGTIAVLAIAVGRKDRWAGGLLIPYWLWVSFAAALNGQLWLLNR